jgi:UDP-N-acetylglucosamine 2-epimerase (non-hydrolysing)
LLEPVDYLSFIYLMKKSYLILTDSGGVQEEAPSLGKPVLIMRDTTERTEAITAGTAILTGTKSADIVHHVSNLLQNNNIYQRMSQIKNPYGDGKTALRIIEILTKYKHGYQPTPVFNHLLQETVLYDKA